LSCHFPLVPAPSSSFPPRPLFSSPFDFVRCLPFYIWSEKERCSAKPDLPQLLPRLCPALLPRSQDFFFLSSTLPGSKRLVPLTVSLCCLNFPPPPFFDSGFLFLKFFPLPPWPALSLEHLTPLHYSVPLKENRGV